MRNAKIPFPIDSTRVGLSTEPKITEIGSWSSEIHRFEVEDLAKKHENPSFPYTGRR